MEENRNGGLLQALLFGGGSGGGATSLNDLSDVEIDTSQVGNLLRYNDNTGKWENVRVNKALLDGYENPDSGVLAMSDVGSVFVSSGFRIDISDTFGQMFSQLLQAAIAYGQYQADDLDFTTFRFLVNSAISNTLYNGNLSYTVISDNHLMLHSFQLVGASADFAVWSGVIGNNDKFYRITFAVICPESAQAASIVVKAEQLMTYTEPT